MASKIDYDELILSGDFAVDNETGEIYQVRSRLTADGRMELPDPVPMEPPVGFTSRGESLVDMVRRFVRSEYVSRQMDEAGFETFEEADDFDVEDDPPDKLTPYEELFEPPVKRSPEVAGAGKPAAAPNGGGPAPASPEASPAVQQGGDGGTIPPVAKP